MPASPTPQRSFGIGLGYAIAAYVLWGVLPLYFLVLEPSGAIEIVMMRVLFSLVFCVVLVSIFRGGWKRLVVIVRDRRTVLLLAVAGVLILANWLVYVYAATSEQVVAASLGYYINPLVTVLLGVIVLRERLRTLQWVAVGISVLAVLVLAISTGSTPWISLVLAFSFGTYGLVKKAVGGSVDAVSGLTVETALLSPVAIVVVVWLGFTGTLTFGSNGPLHAGLLMLAGVVTAVPLLFFAEGARRLPLTIIGLTQYLAPTMQLIVGVVINGEEMPPERWIGFAIVWIALTILTVDMFVHGTRQRAAALAAGAETAP